MENQGEVFMKEEKGFAEKAMEELKEARKEMLEKYPGSSYIQVHYGIFDVMQIEVPDEEGEKEYQKMIREAVKLKFI